MALNNTSTMMADGGGASQKMSYNPDKFKAWANEVMSFIDGASVSINSCSKLFGGEMEKLVQPGVWSGDAAKKNYELFKQTHDALVKLTNGFSKAFEEGMNGVNASLKSLELTNLGSDTNTANYGNLNATQIEEAALLNVATDEVVYDYGKMDSISETLKSINQKLDGVVTDMKKKISSLTTSGAMTGASANELVSKLNECITTNYDAASESIGKCVANINQASRNARNADMVQ